MKTFLLVAVVAAAAGAAAFAQVSRAEKVRRTDRGAVLQLDVEGGRGYYNIVAVHDLADKEAVREVLAALDDGEGRGPAVGKTAVMTLEQYVEENLMPEEGTSGEARRLLRERRLELQKDMRGRFALVVRHRPKA